MLTRVRPRLTYANVMATIAVFIALGGASYAALKLPKNSVGTKQLKKYSVTPKKIKKNAVTGAKIKNGSVTGEDIDLAKLGTVPTADSLTPAEPWHEVGAPGEPQFVGSWNYPVEAAMVKSDTPAFYKDKAGVVHLKGAVGGGSLETSGFVLPPGYRPSTSPGHQLFFLALCSGGTCENGVGVVRIAYTGAVAAPGTKLTYLEGISFRAEP